MTQPRVAVLRGGPSEEYHVSMKTGAAVLEALIENEYPVKDIIITKQGEWVEHGISLRPEIALTAVDVVFIALHGTYGEDGEVQKIIQRLGIPFTGSRAFPSAVAFNKPLTKETLRQHGVLMPAHREVNRGSDDEIITISKSIKETFGPEYIVKPVASGSSFGIEHVSEGQSLEYALENALKTYERVMVEEYIRGREATCATLEGFRNERIYVFPSIEIIPPPEKSFFSTDTKYDGSTMEICPARFSYSDKVAIAEAAALVHEVLDLAQYSRSDFIVSNKGVYFLEVNTLPGLTSESLYPKAAAAVGLQMKDLIAHLVDTATC